MLRSFPRIICQSSLFAALATIGCGHEAPYEIVPVAGTVTLDGRPLADARVVFQPVATAQSSEDVGPGSYGLSDAEGKFKLETVDRQDGAVVARHMVRVTTSQVLERPGDDASRMTSEQVPPSYRNGFAVEVTGATENLSIELVTQPRP